MLSNYPPVFNSVQENCQFKRKLNEAKVLDTGFCDLNAHSVDAYLVNPVPKKAGIKYRVKMGLWIASKLLHASSKKVNGKKILLAPAELGRERSIGLFTPLLPFLKDADVAMIGLEELFSSINLRVFAKWITLIPRIMRQVTEALNKHDPDGILRPVASFLKIDSVVHILCIMQLQHLLKQSLFKSVLVDWDRHRHQALLVIAAKQQGIHTFTFVHGAIYIEEKFVPLIADTCLIWGKQHERFFTGFGEQPDRLLIAGNTRFNDYLPHGKDVKVALNIDDSKKVILHAAQHSPDLCDYEIVQKLASMLQPYQDYLLVVKPHPSQDWDTLHHHLKPLNNVLLLTKNTTTKEALSIAIFTIVVSSTFAIDSLMANVPVTIFQPTNVLKGVALELTSNASAPLIRSHTDFDNLFDATAREGIEHSFNVPAQRAFINAYCASYGDESAALIAAALTA
jgi:hypothetical protein